MGDHDDFLDPGENITCSGNLHRQRTRRGPTSLVTNNASLASMASPRIQILETVTYLAPPTVTKAFLPATIGTGGISTFLITINNSGGTDLTNVTFTDTYPVEIINATPANGSTTCQNGSVTALDGGTSVSLSGATLLAGRACNVTVTVTSSVLGSHTNTIPVGGVSTAQGVSNTSAASDTLTVIPNPIEVIKEVSVDGGSTWEDANTPPGPTLLQGTDPQFRFTVRNTGTFTLSNPTLTDSDFSTASCTIPASLAPSESILVHTYRNLGIRSAHGYSNCFRYKQR